MWESGGAENEKRLPVEPTQNPTKVFGVDFSSRTLGLDTDLLRFRKLATENVRREGSEEGRGGIAGGMPAELCARGRVFVSLWSFLCRETGRDCGYNDASSE